MTPSTGRFPAPMYSANHRTAASIQESTRLLALAIFRTNVLAAGRIETGENTLIYYHYACGQAAVVELSTGEKRRETVPMLLDPVHRCIFVVAELSLVKVEMLDACVELGLLREVLVGIGVGVGWRFGGLRSACREGEQRTKPGQAIFYQTRVSGHRGHPICISSAGSRCGCE